MNARTDQSVDGVRRAALALHALAPADRAWMLERLPHDRRGEVEALLAELASLGIPRDGTLAKAVEGKRPATATKPARGVAPDAAAIANALEGESTALVALALRAHDEARCNEVPPALREALMQEVAPLLIAAANESAAPAAKRWWRIGRRA